MSDLVDLQKLREMRDNGRISVEEFNFNRDFLKERCA